MSVRSIIVGVVFTLTSFSALFAQEELVQPEEVLAVDGVVSDTLTLAISPITVAGKTLTSRLYNGSSPGPTYRLHRGELLRVLLKNQLPPNPDQDSADQGNFPQRLNTTNLHTHGLNVSPSDSSDNVLLEILPGTDFQFHIQLPTDHAAGTYWYHPHHHTSTYGQVVSGLAGTIIVEDVNDPLVTDPALLAIEDRIFVFSLFQYDTATNTLPYPVRNTSAATAFSPYGTVTDSPVLVNGMLNPKVTFRPGEIQRWRMINATYEMNIDVRFLKIIEGDTTQVVHQAIANDGLYFNTMKPSSHEIIPTGARLDFLVTAPSEPGEYVMQVLTRDRQLVAQPDPQFITIVVAGDPIVPAMSMPTRLPIPIAQGDIRDDEITGSRTIVFNVGDFADLATDPTVVSRSFTIDNAPFDHNVVNITLQSGAVEEWTIINNSTDFHPFHIHVNEFQAIEKNGVKFDPPIWWDVMLLDTMSTYKIRHRFGPASGKTVMHCHYLPHEDWGMMNLIDILPKSTSIDEAPWTTPVAFPNPVVGRIDRVNVNIPEFLTGKTLNISLHNVEGNLVSSQTIDPSLKRQASIDVSALPAGTYYLLVNDGGVYRESDMIVLVR
ncbi:MAG TPA: multicopper oxidase domain-containing protein [Candidatus Didemnitutus sp.]|nr:multicopper oxidase domain-containing protein [Candidatus Didemnitutus sp.]